MTKLPTEADSAQRNCTCVWTSTYHGIHVVLENAHDGVGLKGEKKDRAVRKNDERETFQQGKKEFSGSAKVKLNKLLHNNTQHHHLKNHTTHQKPHSAAANRRSTVALHQVQQ